MNGTDASYPYPYSSTSSASASTVNPPANGGGAASSNGRRQPARGRRKATTSMVANPPRGAAPPTAATDQASSKTPAGSARNAKGASSTPARGRGRPRAQATTAAAAAGPPASSTSNPATNAAASFADGSAAGPAATTSASIAHAPAPRGKKSVTPKGRTAYRGSRWASAPSESTLKQYDDTLITIRKWLRSARPEYADAFEQISERTLDAMVLYMDYAVDRGLSYNTISRANSSLAAFFRFRLGRTREEWDSIADTKERWETGNPCCSVRYKARYHSISKDELARRRVALNSGAEAGPTMLTTPILYPHLSVILPFLSKEVNRKYTDTREDLNWRLMHAFITIGYLLWTRLDELLQLKWGDVMFEGHPTPPVMGAPITASIVAGPYTSIIVTLPWREDSNARPKSYRLQFQAQKPHLDAASALAGWATFLIQHLNEGQPLQPDWFVFPSFKQQSTYTPSNKMHPSKILEIFKATLTSSGAISASIAEFGAGGGAGTGVTAVSLPGPASATSGGAKGKAKPKPKPKETGKKGRRGKGKEVEAADAIALPPLLSLSNRASAGGTTSLTSVTSEEDLLESFTPVSLRKGGLMDALTNAPTYGLSTMTNEEAIWWGGWTNEESMLKFLQNDSAVDENDIVAGAVGGGGTPKKPSVRRARKRKAKETETEEVSSVAAVPHGLMPAAPPLSLQGKAIEPLSSSSTDTFFAAPAAPTSTIAEPSSKRRRKAEPKKVPSAAAQVPKEKPRAQQQPLPPAQRSGADMSSILMPPPTNPAPVPTPVAPPSYFQQVLSGPTDALHPPPTYSPLTSSQSGGVPLPARANTSLGQQPRRKNAIEMPAPPSAPSSIDSASGPPVKRPRGRPRKHPLKVTAPPVAPTPAPLAQHSLPTASGGNTTISARLSMEQQPIIHQSTSSMYAPMSSKQQDSVSSSYGLWPLPVGSTSSANANTTSNNYGSGASSGNYHHAMNEIPASSSSNNMFAEQHPATSTNNHGSGHYGHSAYYPYENSTTSSHGNNMHFGSSGGGGGAGGSGGSGYYQGSDPSSYATSAHGPSSAIIDAPHAYMQGSNLFRSGGSNIGGPPAGGSAANSFDHSIGYGASNHYGSGTAHYDNFGTTQNYSNYNEYGPSGTQAATQGSGYDGAGWAHSNHNAANAPYSDHTMRTSGYYSSAHPSNEFNAPPPPAWNGPR